MLTLAIIISLLSLQSDPHAAQTELRPATRYEAPASGEIVARYTCGDTPTALTISLTPTSVQVKSCSVGERILSNSEIGRWNS